MTTRLLIPGREERSEERRQELQAELGDRLDIVSGRRFSLTGTARAAGDAAPAELEANDEDVLELELEHGLALWTSVARYRELLAEGELEAPGGPLRVDRLPTVEVRERGLLGRLLRAVGVWVVGEKGADLATGQLLQRYETEALPHGPGLFRCDHPSHFRAEDRVDEAPAPVDQPLLVLLHGTVSSTRGSFKDLADGEDGSPWAQLTRRYDGRIYTLEHFTLTESPIDNAVALVEKLPQGARLHLVSHSRGGLIGELLCRGPVEEEAIEAFFPDEEAYRPQREKMVRLSALLREKRLQVERFARVACPAAGTLLASDRLDLFLSISLSLLAKAAGPMEPLVQCLRAVVMNVAKRRTRADELPGLEAMIPGSPLTELLNKAPVLAEQRPSLGVIAGDVTYGPNLLRSFANLVGQLIYYRAKHDLVVHSDSMHGGVPRGSGGYLFDQGGEVDHFHYFANRKTREGLLRWLSHSGETLPTDFQPLAQAEAILQVREAPEVKGERPVVVLVPDFMGSSLEDEQGLLWPDPRRLADGGLERLLGPDGGLAPMKAGGLLPHYGPLAQFLARGHRVVPFPYDWRLSLRDGATGLAELLEQELDATRQPVRLLAHGSGGLLVRAMIAFRGSVWEAFADRDGNRALFLGTPWRGSFAALRLLAGQAAVAEQLRLLAARRNRDEVTGWLARLPGLLELLPWEGEWDLLGSRAWEPLAHVAGLGRPESNALDAARQLRASLAAAPGHAGRITYVAGRADATPSGFQVAGNRLRFEATGAGDGVVTDRLGGPPPGIGLRYAATDHAGLISTGEYFADYHSLLRGGSGERLKSSAPTEGVTPFYLPPERVVFPDRRQLEAAALDGEPFDAARARPPGLHVQVTHGDLRYARWPVVVGHYRGDTLASAEAYLDRVLDGALSRRYQLGIYPGEQGTVEVVLRDGKTRPGQDGPAGAVVIGLGTMGRMSASSLAEAVRLGVMRYALELADMARGRTEEAETERAGLSFLVIGSGMGAGLEVEDSVYAILRGTTLANRELRRVGGEGLTVDEVELVQLYEDVAARTAHALNEVAVRVGDEVGLPIFAEPVVREGRGGLLRRRVDRPTGFWRRVAIESRDGGSKLCFVAQSDRARADALSVYTQGALVDALVRDNIRSTAWSTDSSRTLFHLLVPNQFKPRLREQSNLVLVVDRDSARFPWELFAENDGGGVEPLAVRVGIVRQLAESGPPPLEASGTDAVVIGDPKTNWPELPGACQEARLVAEQLNAGGFSAFRSLRDPALDVVNLLFARPYRIVHIAAHGTYSAPDSDGREISGVILGEDVCLTAEEFGKLPFTPELVFLNCCHLGRLGRRVEYNRLAASVAHQLIRSGVRAVVVAGWAVDDQAAQLFATTFYRELMDGQTFGNATRIARQKCYTTYPHVNTWGAYQAYGDPDYLLIVDGAAAEAQSADLPCVSPRELADALADLACQARTAPAGRQPALSARVAALLQAARDTWPDRGDILYQAAEAYAGLGDLAKAIDLYSEAARQERDTPPLRAVEQWLNLTSRSAAGRGVDASGHEREAIRKEIRATIEPLEGLIAQWATVERHSLLGSAYKRLAMLSEDAADLRACLTCSRDGYGAAVRLCRERRGLVDPYPLGNRLAFDLLLGDKSADVVAADLTDYDAAALRCVRENRDVWAEVAAIDAALLRALHESRLAAEIDGLVRRFAGAREHMSAAEFDSVRAQLAFLITAGGQLGGRVGEQTDALESLLQRLPSG